MKTVLITGATSGIGAATARLLAKHNYKVILCGRREDRLMDLEKELSAFTEVHTLQFDVRDKNAVLKTKTSAKNYKSSFCFLHLRYENSAYRRLAFRQTPGSFFTFRRTNYGDG